MGEGGRKGEGRGGRGEKNGKILYKRMLQI